MNQFDMFYPAIGASLKNEGFGNFFTPNEAEKLLFPEALLGKLIYPEIEIFGNEKEFYFLKDGKLLYRGNVDAEGLIATIENEINELNVLVNTYLCLANDDETSLIELRKNPNFDITFAEQLVSGYAKGEENGHYSLSDIFPGLA